MISLIIRCVFMMLFLVLPVASQAQDHGLRKERLAMVEKQIQARGVKNSRVLEAMRQVPRHFFVRPHDRSLAYSDRPLPIGFGQTISQPYIVAYMTEVLRLSGAEKVLEIGTGSGYQAAILAHTAGEVYSIEIVPELYNMARKRLSRLGYDRVRLKVDDGYFGWPNEAPFDRIIVTCAAGHIPPPLIKQLKRGGMMVIPVGPPWMVQTLVLVKKNQADQVTTQALMSVRFVPLVRMK